MSNTHISLHDMDVEESSTPDISDMDVESVVTTTKICEKIDDSLSTAIQMCSISSPFTDQFNTTCYLKIIEDEAIFKAPNSVEPIFWSSLEKYSQSYNYETLEAFYKDNIRFSLRVIRDKYIYLPKCMYSRSSIIEGVFYYLDLDFTKIKIIEYNSYRFLPLFLNGDVMILVCNSIGICQLHKLEYHLSDYSDDKINENVPIQFRLDNDSIVVEYISCCTGCCDHTDGHFSSPKSNTYSIPDILQEVFSQDEDVCVLIWKSLFDEVDPDDDMDVRDLVNLWKC